MERSRYLEVLAQDARLLQDTATQDLTAAVPSCSGWTVADVLRHVAEVYEHKITCIGRGGTKPDPWPPDWPVGRDPVEWFDDARGRLLTLLRDIDPAERSWTWWPADQTAGFWVRRMAQETAVHRVDVELAFGDATEVAADLAVDGVDELLTMMLAGDWSDLPRPGSSGTALVGAGDRVWHVEMQPELVVVREVEPSEPAARADAAVSGPASDVLLWLWGRGSVTAVRRTGDDDVVRRLRERLTLATQ